MIGGKKSTARRAVYAALGMLSQRLNMNGLEAFERAMANATPLLEVRPRRVGGATYQVPNEVRPARREALAQRWVVNAARSRKGQPIARKLFTELLDAANNTGAAVRRKDELQRMAEANRAYAHFRW
jgi:small subunit ribosomal protein S7